MKFSIIIGISFYNEFVEQMLQSVLMQEHKNFELVFVVNGLSKEEFNSIVEKIKLKLNNAYIEQQFIYSDKKSANNARYTGCKNSKYEYVYFLDSDDQFATKDATKKLLDIVEKYQPDIVTVNIQRAVLTSEKPELKNIIYSYIQPDKLLDYNKDEQVVRKNYGTNIAARLVKKSALNGIDFLELPFMQDWNITSKLFPNLTTFFFINEPLYLYIYRNDSNSSYLKNSKQSLLNAFNCIIDINKYFKSNDLEKKYETFLTEKNLKFAIGYIARSKRIHADEAEALCRNYFKERYPFQLKNLFSKSFLYFLSVHSNAFYNFYFKLFELKNIKSLSWLKKAK